MVDIFVKVTLKSMLELVNLEQHISHHRLYTKVDLFAANAIELRAKSKFIASLLLRHPGGVFFYIRHEVCHLAQVDQLDGSAIHDSGVVLDLQIVEEPANIVIIGDLGHLFELVGCRSIHSFGEERVKVGSRLVRLELFDGSHLADESC